MNAKYAGSSSEMVSLMANGGGGQYDMVSASGDADLRLIYGGDVQPVNINLIPAWKNFYPVPAVPAVQHHQRRALRHLAAVGPERAALQHQGLHDRADHLVGDLQPEVQGPVTVPDNPIQIADAALYLSKTKPSLGITDPYELTQPQFNAAVTLLKQQHPLIKKYWALASQEISLFKSGNDGRRRGAGPTRTNTLKAATSRSPRRSRSEGATGWADTWMLAAKAPHPNCAYKWMQYSRTPKVQAEQAVYLRRDAGQHEGLPHMDKIQKGSCAEYHANAPESLLQRDQVLEDAVATCDNGQNDCMHYQHWLTAWTADERVGPGCVAQLAQPADEQGPPGRPDRVVARMSAALWRRAVAAGPAPAHPAAGLVPAHLPRVAGAAARLGVLDGQPVHHEIEHSWTLDNFQSSSPAAYRTIIARTVGMAAAVTVTDAVIAFPFAYFMARIAAAAARPLLFVAILLPLWASYLARVYAWRDPPQGGILNWSLRSSASARSTSATRTGRVDRVLLHLAAVHDPAGLRRARADPRLAARGVARPRRPRLAHAPPRVAPARPARASSPARSSPSR